MKTSRFRYAARDSFAAFDTRIAEPDDVDTLLDAQVKLIRKRQEVLFADRRHALLLVFQGMDCAGKDSTIKHVLTGVNPQGVHVANFKQPTRNEVAHSYLWRYWRQMPPRGHIGVFNRSHYEEVLVMRVHPEYFAERYLPISEPIDDAFWKGRLADLAALEHHLSSNGIQVVKFFLNLSRDEQKERLLARIDRPEKNWKFDPEDLINRDLWDEYQLAFAAAIEATDTDASPWFVIPADHKPTMRALVAQIVAETLADMPIAIPEPDKETLSQLQQARARLVAS
jgi:PPK2 family polyphosphate:nucleotide phosphotransferase